MINQFQRLKSNNNQTKYYKFFWLGFSIYSISAIFSITEIYDNSIRQAIEAVGLIFIFSCGIPLLRFKFNNKYLQFVFITYFLWLVLIILRGWSIDFRFIKDTLFNPTFGIMPYFAPLILLFPKNLSSYRKLFGIITLFGIFYFIYDIVSIRDLLNSDHSTYIGVGIVEYSAKLSIPACFILLTFNYHSKRRIVIAISVVIATLLFAIYQGRRGLTFIISSQIIFSYIIYLINSKNKFLVILLSILFSLYVYIYIYDSIAQSDSKLFQYFIERGTEDTRTGVEFAFYADFKTQDWIFGRGLQGEYYCPDIDENQESDNRSVIETGYLQVILRGGIINLVLMLMIALPAIFFGLFYSKNTLSKAAGIWILLWIFYLYPANMQEFSMYYLIFWISIGICYSKELRNIPENEFKKVIQTR